MFPINGLQWIPTKLFPDDRGFLLQSFTQASLEGFIPKHSIHSFSKKNVARGMHFQKSPFAQAKLIQVLRGRILDVVLDIDPQSQTYGESTLVELTDESQKALFIPKNCAHGFVALEDSLVSYLMDEGYSPPHEQGVSILKVLSQHSHDLDLESLILSDRDQAFS